MSPTARPVVDWTDEGSFRLGGHEFVLTVDRAAAADGTFVLAKPPDLVRRYQRLLDAERPRTVVELGIFRGGSAAFLALLGDLDRLVAFDLDPVLPPALEDLAALPDLAERISLHGGVDQADGDTLRREVLTALGGRPLDLVIDDASHRLEPTRASFDALFPLVRPGGTYIVEDWCVDTGAALVVGDGMSSEQVRRLRALIGLFGQPGFEPPAALVEALGAAAARLPVEPGAVDPPVSGYLLRLMYVAAAADLGGVAEAAAGVGRPLSDFALELLMLSMLRPSVVEAVTIDANWLLVRRGTEALDAGESLVGSATTADLERLLGLVPAPAPLVAS